MSEFAEKFIAHLQAIKDRNRGALATLRHSLSFEPGTYPPAFPHVERFAGNDAHERGALRLALYAVAALYARHPEQQAEHSFAAALGELIKRHDSDSVEHRFVAPRQRQRGASLRCPSWGRPGKHIRVPEAGHEPAFGEKYWLRLRAPAG